jgi:Cof subfamily protein (haloacid dehalogenase superfamily)
MADNLAKDQKMKYKLIAVDMDGTLLDSQGMISQKTKDAIKRVVAKGIVFTVSTGRPIQGVELYRDSLSMDGPFITYNGAMIVMGNTKKILYERGILADDARNVIAYGRLFDTTMAVWSDNQLYVNKMNDRIDEYKKLSQVVPILLSDEEAVIARGITKILWIDTVDKINHYQKVLQDKLDGGVTFCTSKPIFLEFFDHAVSKALAMEKLGSYLGIQAEEMVAIGDGFNDLDMLEYAGLGVAMENAPAEIKQKADFVTRSNDEDGVAYFLDQFI